MTRSPASITTLPEQLRRSLTWGSRGAECDGPARAPTSYRTRHSHPTSATRTAPGSAAPTEHQRGSSVQYFPKGTKASARTLTRRTLADGRRGAEQPATRGGDSRLEDPPLNFFDVSTHDLSNNKLLRRPLEPGAVHLVRTTARRSTTTAPRLDRLGRRRLRQRARRELRRQLQDRADPRPRLANPNPARTRDRRVRRLVQHRTPPHLTWRRPTRRVPNPPRKTDRVTKSTEDLPLILRGNQPKQSPSNPGGPSLVKVARSGYVRSKSVLFCSLRAH